MYLFCNLRIHVITLYSGHVSVYYASMLRCWHLIWILVRTDHPCLGVGCYNEGICGTHQLTHKMKWLLQRVGFYWSTMLNDYFRYYKGCESCQKFRDVQLAPTAMLHPTIKPWPFHGWALDFIGQIHPASSKGHRFVLVTTDYFTKWMEVVPLKNA
jgi:hypothetical protein